MKNKILNALLSVLLVSGVLVGCGQNKDFPDASVNQSISVTDNDVSSAEDLSDGYHPHFRLQSFADDQHS
ncbi:MAG: hypothetical protein IKN55_08350 [Oscillospiraceae bacterium]|nr:hypothetical protein [Oscillospiraceae bacterium]